MTLFDKYKALLGEAKILLEGNMQLLEEDGTLTVRGIAPSADVKNKLWDIYGQLDPNFIGKDVLLDIRTSPTIVGCKARLLAGADILNIHKGPGVESETIGQVEKNETVFVLSRANVYWWLIRAAEVEGYCYVQNIKILDEP